MAIRRRRQFFADVGRGMLIAGTGYAAALDLGLTSAMADDDLPERLTFGDREPLVRLMQDTDPADLMPQLVTRWKNGMPLQELVAAAALANARTFGGEDYIGFHTLMALTPAWQMSQEMPTSISPLPILKVLYRNTHRIQDHGGHASEVLHPIVPVDQLDPATVDALLAAVHAKDRTRAEALLAAVATRSPEQAFNDLLHVVQENAEVHRVVLPYRAWDLLDIVGYEHASTLLRQSVRYCVKSEGANWNEYARGGSRLLPSLFDQYRLASATAGRRIPDDNWVDSFSQTIFASSPEQAADAVAAALSEGIAPDAVGEAITLAANQLLLRDMGRPEKQTSDGKPLGSTHGDSIGVHACDSANAWRNMARVSSPRNTFACLILGAWQVAFDRTSRGGDFLNWQPWPLAEHIQQFESSVGSGADQLINTLEAAIQNNDQAMSCAVVSAMQKSAQDPTPVFAVLRRYAISEDGALHAEKYYRTVSQEFAETRPALRWRHLIALARVTASEYGRPAAGMDVISDLLKS